MCIFFVAPTFFVNLLGCYFWLNEIDNLRTMAVLGGSLVVLCIILWITWWRADNYEEFASTTCVQGVFQLHPTPAEVSIEKLRTRQVFERMTRARQKSPSLTRGDFSAEDPGLGGKHAEGGNVLEKPSTTLVSLLDQKHQRDADAFDRELASHRCGCCNCIYTLFHPKEDNKSWFNIEAGKSLFFVFLDVYQLCALSTLPVFYPEDAPTAYVFQFAFFETDFMLHAATGKIIEYWVIMGLVFVWLVMCGMLLDALWRRDFHVVNSLEYSGDIINILSNGLFLLITQKLLNWVDCTFYEDGSPATLDYYDDVLDVEVNCWIGFHWHYGTWALVFLVFYLLSVSTIGVFFLEDPNPAIDVRWRESHVVLERNLKFMILVGATFFSEAIWQRMLGTFVAFLILAVVMFRNPAPTKNCSCLVPTARTEDTQHASSFTHTP